MGEADLIAKLIPNAVSAVAVIVVVWMFLKSNKQTMEEVKTISHSCHEQSREAQKLYQEQLERVLKVQEKITDGYQGVMTQAAAAIARNGDILLRMEIALNEPELRRGSGRRRDDWDEEGKAAGRKKTITIKEETNGDA